MSQPNPIITKTSKISDEIYHLDINQYNLIRSCSIYLLKTPESIVILDTGTSNDVNSIINFMKNNNFPLKKIKYLVPSHHHFDHFGGGWKIWKAIKKFNSDIKVLTTKETQKMLQDPENHMNRAKHTFGSFIGTMKPLPDDAYELVCPGKPIPIPGLKKRFELIATPGHTSDHVCPSVSIDNQTEFIYLSESAGGLLHSQKLLTVPSSMPPDFNFKTYLQSIEKIITLKSFIVGFAHAGVVRGHREVLEVLNEHKEFSFFFRDFVKSNFTKKGETRYVVDQFIEKILKSRNDLPHLSTLYTKYVIAVVYGQLIDLGLKSPK
ncbi:MAG: MBL fold metallo-hydrolase [Promethearchaeota archaeon]